MCERVDLDRRHELEPGREKVVAVLDTHSDDEAVGRREQHKRATRAALKDAATRLFAERGVAQTTVRDIADAAEVTERTFFRYFRSKEDLVIEDAFSWMPAFQQLILARPADEPPLVAVHRALGTVMGALTRSDAASPLTLFADEAPAKTVGFGGRTVMLKLEGDLADTLQQRLAAASPAPGVDVRFRAELLARTAVAAFRTAMLYDLHLRRTGRDDRPPLTQLLDDAFDLLHDPVADPAPSP